MLQNTTNRRRAGILSRLLFVPVLLGIGYAMMQAGRAPQAVTTHRDQTIDTPTVADAQAEAKRERMLLKVEAKREKIKRNGAKRYDQPQEAMDFFVSQRVGPGEDIPFDRLAAARDDIRNRQAALGQNPLQAAESGGGGWIELGPGNIGGRTRAFVIHPGDPSILYAAGVAGGVWKSTDAGASWVVLDDTMLNLAVSTLAMDPTDPETLYAGTGEGFFNGGSVRGAGIFKTTDGGATWDQLSGTVSGIPSGAFNYVNKIVISPNDADRLYAGTRSGVWRSLDAGVSWSILLTNPLCPLNNPSCGFVGCTDIAVRWDSDPDVLFAAFGSFTAIGLFRSQDGGQTWNEIGTPSNLQRNDQGRMAIAIAPSNNDVVYVCMANNGETDTTGALVDVFRTTNGGDTWSPRVNLADDINPLLLSNPCFTGSSQGWYDNIIAVDPLDEDIVWVGGIDLFRSDDGGVNFGVAAFWESGDDDPEYVHADQHMIVFHPNYNGTSNQTMYATGDGGVFRTDNARASTSNEGCLPSFNQLPDIVWTSLNNGYGVTQFYHGDASQSTEVFGGGAQDNGTNLVTSSSTPNDWFEILGGDGGYFFINPQNPNVMYAETQRFPRIQKSVNGGISFFPSTNGIDEFDGLFINPFAMVDANPNLLWTGATQPWRTTNAAGLWTSAGPDFDNAFLTSAIAIAPSDSSEVYFGFCNGYVARTSDGTAEPVTWQVFGAANGLQADTFGDFCGSWISSIAFDPTNPDVGYCTYSTYGLNHVLKTTNGGSSWFSIDGFGQTGIPDIPVHWIAIRPTDSNELFVGTELGVFRSLDGGLTWAPFNNGMPNTVVESLDFRNENDLVAFTHGRGAFMFQLSPPDCNENGVEDIEDIVNETSLDCNENLVPDECDIAACFPGGAFCGDCNQNGLLDDCELPDCNGNGRPDDCDILLNTSGDCNSDSIPDECGPDCNDNGTPDVCDILNGVLTDNNANSLADECEIVFVDLASAGGDGRSWANAFPSLNAAFEAAVMSDNVVQEIWVMAGVYAPAEADGARTESFHLPSGVAVYGGFAGDETFRNQRDPVSNLTVLTGDLNGNDQPDGTNTFENAYHVVTVSAADGAHDGTTLDGFTIRSGNAQGIPPDTTGGGVWIDGGAPTIRNCIIEDNLSFRGGGVHVGGGSASFVDCIIRDNSADTGGGVSTDSGANPLFDGCVIESNDGGGVRNSGGATPTFGDTFIRDNVTTGGGAGVQSTSGATATYERCSITGNVSMFGDGGGLFNSNGSDSFMTACLVSDNEAFSRGGGMYNFDSDVVAVNCVFSQNRTMDSVGTGGAMHNAASSPTLTNCTLYSNTAPGEGGGLYHTGVGTTLTVTNCVVWNNTAGAVGTVEDAQIRLPFGSPAINYSNIQGLSGSLGGTGNIGSSPLFVGAPSNLRLSAGSACIDAGNNSADTDATVAGVQPLPNTDFDGNLRFFDEASAPNVGNGPSPIVDMGAFERQDCTLPTVIGQPVDSGGCIGSTVAFEVQVAGTQPISFQWRLDGAEIAGATDSELSIGPILVGDAGAYDVVMMNACGSVTTATATLTIETEIPEITLDPFGQSVCPGDSATLTVEAVAEGGVFYQWRRNGSVISGATEPSLTVDNFGPTNIGSYTVAVTNSCGTAVSAGALLQTGTSPIVTDHPSDVTDCSGSTVMFSVQVNATEPLSYQWRHDSVDISGATGVTLTLSGIAVEDGGAYDVVVTNPCGQDVSSVATLSVIAGPFGDSNGDCDVDLADYQVFQLSCFSDNSLSPNFVPPPAGCLHLDSDGDGDVDVFDFGAFQATFGDIVQDVPEE